MHCRQAESEQQWVVYSRSWEMLMQLVRWPTNLGQNVEPKHVMQSIRHEVHVMLHVQVSAALHDIWA